MTVKSTAEDLPQRLIALESENARLKEENSQLIQKNASLRALIENSDDTVRKSELKYRTIFENNGTPTFIVNKDTTLALVNHEAEKLLGYTKQEMEGIMSWTDFIIEAKDMDKIQAYHDQRRVTPESVPRQYSAKGRTKSGEIKEVIFNVAMIPGTSQSLVSLLDITEQRRLEQQLIHAQRMESIGNLAGGVAHDFNNLLMAILGNVYLLLEQDRPCANHERLKYIEKYSYAGVNLTQQLLGFARGGKYEVVPVNLNVVIEKSSEMFGRTRREITVHRDFEPEIRMVEVDPNQMEQVLLNLYVNAAQAMPRGGDMHLTTRNVDLDAGFVNPYDCAPGQYVNFTVTDAGQGMDEATRQKVFDPFFTTKQKERGTGLGLASAYGIVKNHGGFITVRSKINQGSTFSIYLPAAKGETMMPDTQREENDEILHGSESVLLIDDEAMVLDVSRELLEGLGYSVATADSGRAAIDTLAAQTDDIDLVILDFTMPEMGGEETFRRLKSIRPDVPVLVSSGFSLNDEVREILQHERTGFIQKPFRLHTLSQKVREVLDA